MNQEEINILAAEFNLTDAPEGEVLAKALTLCQKFKKELAAAQKRLAEAEQRIAELEEWLRNNGKHVFNCHDKRNEEFFESQGMKNPGCVCGLEEILALPSKRTGEGQ